MKRRDFTAHLVGSALAWPLVLRAQQPTRRIAVLMGYPENDPEAQSRFAAFKERLAALGWSEGRNARFDVRWGGNNPARASAHAKELVGLKPDVILGNTTPATAALQRETRTIPIVFTLVADPLGSGFVKSFSRPGGNLTGFRYHESVLSEKWLELLKQVAPRVTRASVMGAARHVDRILRGAKPEELPVEQLNRFELVINLKTAKALGVAIPQSLLLRADRVIE